MVTMSDDPPQPPKRLTGRRMCGARFASYVLQRDVLEAFFQRLKGDLA